MEDLNKPQEEQNANFNLEINAERDVFSNVTNYINESGRKTEELLHSLSFNRTKLEEHKETYAKITIAEGGLKSNASRSRNTYFAEIQDRYNVIESVKHELKIRGVDYEVDTYDREHPNAAFNRFKKEWETPKSKGPIVQNESPPDILTEAIRAIRAIFS